MQEDERGCDFTGPLATNHAPLIEIPGENRGPLDASTILKPLVNGLFVELKKYTFSSDYCSGQPVNSLIKFQWLNSLWCPFRIRGENPRETS